MAGAKVKGGDGFVSPYTGEVFGSQFAFNDHLTRWPEIAAANRLNLDGSPMPPTAPSESPEPEDSTEPVENMEPQPEAVIAEEPASEPEAPQLEAEERPKAKRR